MILPYFIICSFIYFKTALCGLLPFLYRHCFFSVLASAYPKVISSTKCLHKSTNLFISYWYFSLKTHPKTLQKYESLNSKRYFSGRIFNLFQFSSFFQLDQIHNDDNQEKQTVAKLGYFINYIKILIMIELFNFIIHSENCVCILFCFARYQGLCSTGWKKMDF